MSEDIKPTSNASNEQLQYLVEGFKDLIKASPKLQKKILRNTEERSGGNYYNRNDAEKLKPFLDEMIVDGEPREFRFVDYPQWSPNTVWLKINQAIKYIVDNLDTEDRKYAIFRNRLKICKIETGVLFKIVDSPTINGWIAHKVSGEISKELETYKDQVFRFMETSEEGEELDLKDLTISEEEVIKMKELLDPSPIFAAFVSCSRIKIIHLRSEQIT